MVNQAVQTINFTQPTSPVTYSSGLTIPLSATGGASGNPVVFTIDTSSSGTGSITGSTLTVTAAGTFVIDANQAGNTNYSAATQVQKSVVVNAVPTVSAYAVASPTPTQTVQPGGAATYTINVNPVNGAFNSVVTLSASGLPAGAQASFVPAYVTPGSAGASSVLTIQTAAPSTSAKSSGLLLATPVLGLIGVFAMPGKRRKRQFALGALLLLSLISLIALAGCGGGFAMPQATSENYTITVTGTSGVNTTQSTTVLLTVK